MIKMAKSTVVSAERRLNKQYKRRRDGLRSKCFKYGDMPGVELALLVRYTEKDCFYVFQSKKDLPWLGNMQDIVRY